MSQDQNNNSTAGEERKDDWRGQDPARRRGQLHLGAQDIHVEFDPEHLRRVLINLLDNAVRHSPLFALAKRPECRTDGRMR